MKNDPRRVHAYITLHALTKGIFEADVIPIDDGMAKDADPRFYLQHYRPGDWHLTREAALARAEEMRNDAIASLRSREF